MRNAGLEEAQARIKIAGTNINMISLICGIKKNYTNEFIYKTGDP